jgi:glycosyltransferase involved in cell wall biosynthesis
LFLNINETIGVPYQLVFIDNSKNEFDIFKAYNKGILESQHDIICFMHDDIQLNTPNWGFLAVEKFNDPAIGAIGLAGTAYASWMPGTWWSVGETAQNILHVNETSQLRYNSKNEITAPVVLLDGVWMCVRKNLFEKIQFDDASFKGFHMYDMDISLQIYKQNYKLLTVFDIDIIHQSTGNINKVWIQNRIALWFKWRKQLPLSVISYSWYDMFIFETKALYSFIKNILKF